MKIRKKYLLAIVISSALALVLAACGGGGGGGGGGATSGSSTSSVSISGLVGSGGGGSSSSGASLRGSAISEASFLIGSKVTIKSYDTSGNLLDEVQTTTISGGAFNGNIKVVSTGGYITVSAVSDGFTHYEKTFKYSSLSDLEGLNILAEIDPVLTKVIPIAQAGNFTSASGDDTVSIAIVKNSRGEKQILTNSSEIKSAAADGSSVIWQLDMPRRALLAANITSVKVNANNYDPSNEDDSRRFPSNVDASGNTLISTGFDFIDVRDQNGQPIKLSTSSVSGISTSATVTYKVKRQIPNCTLIIKDEDTVKPGVQVGFYFLRDGKWRKLGNATLYVDNNPKDGTIDDSELMSNVGDCAALNLPYAIMNQTDITDLDFSNNWWNLDYVAIGTINTGCLTGVVNSVKSDGTMEPLKGQYIYLSDLTVGGTTKGGFRSSYGTTKQNGSYNIEFTYTDALSNPNATLNYSNPFTWSWTTISNSLSDSNKDAQGCYVLNLQIADPYSCKVKGVVYKPSGTAPANDRLIFVSQPNTWYGQKWKRTDDNGAYDIDVACNTEYTMKLGGTEKAFIADGIANAVGNNAAGKPYHESTDTGTVVTMKDITLANNLPSVYASAWDTRVFEGGKVPLSSWGSDPDNDPLTYTWSDTCGGVFNTTSPYSSQYPQWTAPVVIANGTVCSLTITANDGQGGTGTASVDIQVSKIGNRAPVITSILSPMFMKVNASARITSNSYDPDINNTLTYGWSDNCSGAFSNAVAQNPTWTAPGTGSSCTLTLLVTDSPGGATASRNAYITVLANRAPVIQSINAPSPVAKKKTVQLYSSANDFDGDALTYSWSDNCSGAFSSTTAQNPTWTAPPASGTCIITLNVSDSQASASQSKTVSVVNNKPVITLFGVPSTALVGSTYTLSGSATDADGDTLTYMWTDNLGTIGTGTSISWTPASAGTYTITLTVSDGTDTASQSRAVSVSVPANNPPVITSFSVPSTASVGVAITLSGSATDADGDTLTYTWKADSTTIGTGTSVSWNPTAGGTFTISLTVSDGKDTAYQSKAVLVSAPTGSDDTIIINRIKI
ncbi:MAG: PKD domain-containing protein [Thermodesulfovibrionales bacterium]|nr:PKD domain-containing protein [Thermodesulfovibrionales bacterium]